MDIALPIVYNPVAYQPNLQAMSPCMNSRAGSKSPVLVTTTSDRCDAAGRPGVPPFYSRSSAAMSVKRTASVDEHRRSGLGVATNGRSPHMQPCPDTATPVRRMTSMEPGRVTAPVNTAVNRLGVPAHTAENHSSSGSTTPRTALGGSVASNCHGAALVSIEDIAAHAKHIFQQRRPGGAVASKTARPQAMSPYSHYRTIGIMPEGHGPALTTSAPSADHRQTPQKITRSPQLATRCSVSPMRNGALPAQSGQSGANRHTSSNRSPTPRATPRGICYPVASQCPQGFGQASLHQDPCVVYGGRRNMNEVPNAFGSASSHVARQPSYPVGHPTAQNLSMVTLFSPTAAGTPAALPVNTPLLHRMAATKQEPFREAYYANLSSTAPPAVDIQPESNGKARDLGRHYEGFASKQSPASSYSAAKVRDLVKHFERVKMNSNFVMTPATTVACSQSCPSPPSTSFRGNSLQESMESTSSIKPEENLEDNRSKLPQSPGPDCFVRLISGETESAHVSSFTRLPSANPSVTIRVEERNIGADLPGLSDTDSPHSPAHSCEAVWSPSAARCRLHGQELHAAQIGVGLGIQVSSPTPASPLDGPAKEASSGTIEGDDLSVEAGAKVSFELGDFVKIGGGALPEHRGKLGIVTKVAETHCTVALLDEERRFVIGECWPNYEDVSVEDRVGRVGTNVTIQGLTAKRLQPFNGLTGVVMEHPREGHPCFIQKASRPDDPLLVLCIRLDKPPPGEGKQVLLECRYLVPSLLCCE